MEKNKTNPFITRLRFEMEKGKKKLSGIHRNIASTMLNQTDYSLSNSIFSEYIILNIGFGVDIQKLEKNTIS